MPRFASRIMLWRFARAPDIPLIGARAGKTASDRSGNDLRLFVRSLLSRIPMLSGAGFGIHFDQATAVEIHECMRRPLLSASTRLLVRKPRWCAGRWLQRAVDTCGAMEITVSRAVRSCAALPPFMVIGARTVAAAAADLL